MPHMWLGGPRCNGPQYLEHGYVYVTCGNRGSESKDKDGKLCGKSPANLIDLKTCLRFLRHNKKSIPGDFNKIISVGFSAGGAMSTLLGVTGNNEIYNKYLEENGAFMDETDDVFASQIYCPIIDLEHADLAYEWMFTNDKENESSPAGPAGLMTPFREALSKVLYRKYIEYFNSLELGVELGEDGRSGTAYQYLMDVLNASATKYLSKLDKCEMNEKYSVQDYLEGNYEYQKMAPPMQKKDIDEGKKGSNLMQGHAGVGVSLRTDNLPHGEPPTLGDMLSRPPKGVAYESKEPPMITVRGENKTSWLKWDGNKASIKDLDTYILNHRRRMKPCTSFDTLDGKSGENRLFGTEQKSFMHYNSIIADAIAELKNDFPKEYEEYYTQFQESIGDKALENRIYVINPMNFINNDGKSTFAKHFRIRVGSCDADTSFTISMTLALKLKKIDIAADYALVWDQPHCNADYPGEFAEWIDEISY